MRGEERSKKTPRVEIHTQINTYNQFIIAPEGFGIKSQGSPRPEHANKLNDLFKNTQFSQKDYPP